MPTSFSLHFRKLPWFSHKNLTKKKSKSQIQIILINIDVYIIYIVCIYVYIINIDVYIINIDVKIWNKAAKNFNKIQNIPDDHVGLYDKNLRTHMHTHLCVYTHANTHMQICILKQCSTSQLKKYRNLTCI